MIILNHFLIEGIMVYIKAIVILFELIYEKIIKTQNSSLFFQCFETFIQDFDDYVHFNNLLNNFYLNEELLNYARTHLIDKETKFFNRKGKIKKASEECCTSSPFCFQNKNSNIDKDENFILKVANIFQNINYSYFEISNDLFSYCKNLVRKYTDDSFTDSLYRKKLHANKSSSYLNKKYEIDTIKNNQTNYSPIINARKDIEKSELFTSKIENANNLYSPKFTNENGEDDIIILRSSHSCHLGLFIAHQKLYQKDILKIFFEKNKINLYSMLGNKVKMNISNKYPVLNYEINNITDIKTESTKIRPFKMDKKNIYMSINNYCCQEESIHLLDTNANHKLDNDKKKGHNSKFGKISYEYQKSIEQSVDAHYFFETVTNP